MTTTRPAYPPYRMKADTAAQYCDMSVSSFFRAVDQGRFPRGRKEHGGTFWLRHALEAAMNNESAPQHDFTQAI